MGQVEAVGPPVVQLLHEPGHGPVTLHRARVQVGELHLPAGDARRRQQEGPRGPVPLHLVGRTGAVRCRLHLEGPLALIHANPEGLHGRQGQLHVGAGDHGRSLAGRGLQAQACRQAGGHHQQPAEELAAAGGVDGDDLAPRPAQALEGEGEVEGSGIRGSRARGETSLDSQPFQGLDHLGHRAAAQPAPALQHQDPVQQHRQGRQKAQRGAALATVQGRAGR